jgi:hypothetical protein
VAEKEQMENNIIMDLGKMDYEEVNGLSSLRLAPTLHFSDHSDGLSGPLIFIGSSTTVTVYVCSQGVGVSLHVLTLIPLPSKL